MQVAGGFCFQVSVLSIGFFFGASTCQLAIPTKRLRTVMGRIMSSVIVNVSSAGHDTS